ncbi:MAG: mechanosensitive ion channel family protein [Bacteroidetes bacterium]|nr:MAG: mechanosensitive ion channel family protein [Bacteroidota bacterium]
MYYLFMKSNFITFFEIILLKKSSIINEEVDMITFYTQKLMHWLVEFTPKLILATLTLFIGYWIIGMLSRWVRKALEKKEIEVSLRTFLKSMVSIGLKIVLLISVAGMLGFQNTSLVAILGAASLAIGLALQGSLSNFAGGVLILIFKPYKVGDIIETQSQTGKVSEIQIFNTILLTPDNKTIILPNGSVANGTIINFSKEGSIGINIDIEIGYENNIAEARNILLDVMSKHKKLHKTPEQLVIVVQFGDGSITLGMRALTAIEDAPLVRSELREQVKIALEKNEITRPPIKRVVV